MVRTLLVGLLLVGAGCPGPKVEPAAAATAEVPLEGGWFLLDTPLGPPSARLVLGDGTAQLLTLDGGQLDFNTSPEGRGLELRGPYNVLLADRTDQGGLIVYTASGATSYAYPIIPLDPAFLGEWRLRDPALPAGRTLRVLKGSGGADKLVADGRTFDLWAVRRPEGLAFVVLPPGADGPAQGVLWQLHGIDDGWLVTGPQPGKAHVLMRPDGGPVWVGADTGDVPEGPNPWLPAVE